ncbi:hypothetical protein [Nonomuraea sp. NPDC046570]|uniref:hypothetical protein n=1 Tax=Nonomuraea sp. NPDC046570 TaxID=3155255 RepID=UPI0033F2C358
MTESNEQEDFSMGEAALQLDHDRLVELVDDLTGEFGPPTEQELSAARAEWGDT